MIGTPLAALDVILGVAGVPGTIASLRAIDREMDRVTRARNPQAITPPANFDKQLGNQRALTALLGEGSKGMREYSRSITNFQKVLNAPTRDYAAADRAMKAIEAGKIAKQQIQDAKDVAAATRVTGQQQIRDEQARVRSAVATEKARVDSANTTARAEVNRRKAANDNAKAILAFDRQIADSARENVRSQIGGLRTLTEAHKPLLEIEKNWTQTAKTQVGAWSAAKAKEITLTGQVTAAERVLQKSREEIAVRQRRMQNPGALRREFDDTVQGQQLNKQLAALTKSGGDTSGVEEKIRMNLRARAASHQINLDTQLRQEKRYNDNVLRLRAQLVGQTAEVARTRGLAGSAITGRNAATANVDTSKLAIDAQRARVATARADLDAARATVGVSRGAVATTTALLQTARASATLIAEGGRSSLATLRSAGAASIMAVRDSARTNTASALQSAKDTASRLGPIVAAGGSQAASAFQNAMKGANPVEYILGVMGGAVGVVKAGFGEIASIGKAGLNVLGFAFNIVSAGASAFMGVLKLIGGGLMNLGGLAMQAGGAMASLLANPVVGGVLTGGLSLVVSHLQEIIKYAGLAVAAVAAFSAYQIVMKGSEYDQSAQGVRAAMGYSPGMGNNPAGVEKEMQRLQPGILQIAADTQYNNAQVADGVRELLRGGLKVDQITDEVMRMLFNVSAATDSGVTDSAKVVDSLIQLFQVPKDQLVHVGDMVAGVVNSSLMDMPELGSALRQLGPLAKTMGISYEDTLTALTQLAGAGFRGEIGGTALRNMLLYLNPRSDKAKAELKDVGIIDEAGNNRAFDNKGNLKSLPDLFALLRGPTQGMDDEEQLQFFTKVFGTRSASAAMVLSGTDPAKYEETKGRITGQSAAGTAQTMLNSVNGKVEILTGTLESLASTLFMNFLASPLKGLLDYLIGRANGVYAFFSKTTDLGKGFYEMFGETSRASAFLGIIKQFVDAGSFLSGMNLTNLQVGLEAIFTSGTKAPMATDTFRKYLMNPLIQTIRVLQLGKDAVVTFAQAFRGEWGGALTGSINPVIRVLGIFGTYWGNIYKSLKQFVSGDINLTGFLTQLTGGFSRLLQELGGNIDMEGPGLMERIKGWWTYLKGVGGEWWTKSVMPEVDQVWTGVTTWIESKKPALVTAWNGLWNTLLGTKPGGPTGPSTNPLEGLAVTDPTIAGEQEPTGLGEIFGKALDKAQEVFQKRIKPTLDIILTAAQEWWKDNGATVGAFGVTVGQAIGNGLMAGVKGLFGPNWMRDVLIAAGAPKDIVTKIFPDMAPGNTKEIPGFVPGSKLTVPKDYEPMPDPIGDAMKGIGRFMGDVNAKWASTFFGDVNQGAGGQSQADIINARKMLPGWGGKGASDNVEWDDAFGRWVPRGQATGQGRTPGNPDLPQVPGGRGFFPPPGTIPLALPNTGGGMAGEISALSQLAAQALAAAAVPRVIQVQGSGLTTVEFFEQLGKYLNEVLDNRATTTAAGAAAGSRVAGMLGQ